jgi:hypothetical protein
VRAAALPVLLAHGLLSCASISPFSLTAYEQATSLKVDALALVSRAGEPFRDHREEVAALVERIEKAYEFARGRPNNEITTRQWEILKDPERRSLGGFLKRWERESTLSEPFIREAKGLVADGFDTIIELESGKRGAADVQAAGQR